MKHLPLWLVQRICVLSCLCFAGTISYPALANVVNTSLPFFIITIFSFVTGLAGLTAPFVKISTKLCIILTVIFNILLTISYIALATITEYIIEIYIGYMIIIFIREIIENRLFVITTEYLRVHFGEYQMKFQELFIFNLSLAEIIAGIFNILLAFIITPHEILVIGSILLFIFNLFSAYLLYQMSKDI